MDALIALVACDTGTVSSKMMLDLGALLAGLTDRLRIGTKNFLFLRAGTTEARSSLYSLQTGISSTAQYEPPQIRTLPELESLNQSCFDVLLREFQAADNRPYPGQAVIVVAGEIFIAQFLEYYLAAAQPRPELAADYVRPQGTIVVIERTPCHRITILQKKAAT